MGVLVILFERSNVVHTKLNIHPEKVGLEFKVTKILITKISSPKGKMFFSDQKNCRYTKCTLGLHIVEKRPIDTNRFSPSDDLSYNCNSKTLQNLIQLRPFSSFDLDPYIAIHILVFNLSKLSLLVPYWHNYRVSVKIFAQ